MFTATGDYLPSLASDAPLMPQKTSKRIADLSRINYFSALPQECVLQKILGDAYVINKPMKEVGGDGYWIHEDSGSVFFAVFDCMGHGHMATIMTRIYLNAIEEAISTKGLTDPASIIQDIHDQLTARFEGKDNKQIGTGADIAILVLNKRKKTLQYSGAKMDLVYVENGHLHRIKASKRSVGEYFDFKRDYQTITLKYKGMEKTKFYLFSDGITDLFGGPKDKKLGYRGLSEMLAESHQLDLSEEKKSIEKKLKRWSGSIPPLDDQLLIAFTFSSIAK
ncbi:MAG: SpoIIE family protein phosphatase [Cyclobacteriaceae bacterium]|nr:SpoIIE family protein phosphatase [Cyclobacteriaceae bacterium HetDA_MAG_MS6]